MVRNMIPNLIGTAIMALAVMVHPAAAQPLLNCAEHSKVVDFLGLALFRDPAGCRLHQPGVILEVYVSESGSWTMLVTNANGSSCVVFAGQSWETIPVVPGLKT